jgi:glycosyltransferase involved in cell wall biosynthesis
MVLMINCANLRFGGGLTVGFNIINYFKKSFSAHTLIVVAPSNCGYERFRSANTKVIELPPVCNRAVAKPFVNYILLPALSVFYKTDCVISLGNVAFPSRAPHLLLIMFPYLAYPETEVWKKLNKQEYRTIKSMVAFVKMNLKYANAIFLQTETMRQRIAVLFPSLSQKLHVIPCAVSFTSMNGANYNSENGAVKKTPIRLLCLSKYYVHKNLEIILKMAEIIRQKKLNITITTTMEANENKGSQNFLHAIKENSFENIIINIGHVNIDNVAKVYSTHNGLFLPTLLESFSGTYIESMYFEKPVFTSDLDFAHDVCKDAAFYFNPFDANNILEVIVNAFKNPESIKQKVELGIKYLSEYKTWDEIGKVLEDQLLRTLPDKQIVA